MGTAVGSSGRSSTQRQQRESWRRRWKTLSLGWWNSWEMESSRSSKNRVGSRLQPAKNIQNCHLPLTDSRNVLHSSCFGMGTAVGSSGRSSFRSGLVGTVGEKRRELQCTAPFLEKGSGWERKGCGAAGSSWKAKGSEHPKATEGILEEEVENAVAPLVEFLGNGKQQKQQEQSWKQAPAGPWIPEQDPGREDCRDRPGDCSQLGAASLGIGWREERGIL
ncbi:uncharacterized protein ACIQIH_000584 [Cyanocitta cristata]